MEKIPLTTLHTVLELKLSNEGMGYCANISRTALYYSDADKTIFEVTVNFPIDISEQDEDIKEIIKGTFQEIVFGKRVGNKR